MSAVASTPEKSSAFFGQFRLLTRYPNFGLLWSGQVVSHLGDALNSIALIWLVQEMTGSRAMMGAISAVISATALFGLVAGALVDRWDRRITMLISDVLRMLVILTLPALIFGGRLQVWHLFAVGAAMGLLAQLFYPAKQSLLPHLVSPDDLTGANALSQMAYMLLMAIGYGVGGVLLGFISTGQLFTLDAATFAISAVTIWLIRMPKQAAATEAEPKSDASSSGQLVGDIVEGLRYMRSDILIATTIPVAIIANFIFAPLMVLFAAWSKDVLFTGAQGYGFLQGSFLVGNLLGTLSANVLDQHIRRGRLVVLGVITMGLPLILFALYPNLFLNGAMLAIIGFANGLVNIALITTFQQRVPDAMMGRFFGAFIGLSMLAAPIGVALGGIIADFVPLAYMFGAIGVAMSLLGVSLIRNPAIHEFDQ